MTLSSRRRKICVIVNSRANYGRIKAVLGAIREHPQLELQLVAGASALLWRFGSAIDVIKADGFRTDATVYMVLEGENPTTMAKTTGLGIIELATIFENLRPDIVLTIADRFETIAAAIAASYMNIPVAHTQGGEITGSIDESVRHACSKLAHIHFPATEPARRRLVAMGEEPERIFMVGCPSIDVLVRNDLSLDGTFASKYGRTGVWLPVDFSKPYLIVLQHPVTTEYGRGFEQIQETLQAVFDIGMQAVWLWPNVDAGSDDISKGLRVFREQYQPEFIHFYRNFPVEDYARLLNNAACIVGNSSSGLREGSYMGVPCVNIGTRQQGRDRGGNVIDVDYSAAQIREAIQSQVAHGRYPRSTLYGDGQASARISEILSTVEVPIQKRMTY